MASGTSKTGFPFKSCSSSRGQRPCELQAITSCLDKAGKLAVSPCLGLLRGSVHRLWSPGQVSCAFKCLLQGPEPFLLDWQPLLRLVWGGGGGGGQPSSFTFFRKCRGYWLALAPTPGPSFLTSHSSSDQVWFSCLGSPPPSWLSPAGITRKTVWFLTHSEVPCGKAGQAAL